MVNIKELIALSKLRKSLYQIMKRMGGTRDNASQERWQLSVCIDDVRARKEALQSLSPAVAHPKKLLQSIAEVRQNIRQRLFWERYQKGSADKKKLETCLEAIETWVSIQSASKKIMEK